MADGTRSKNAKRNNQKTQFENHTNLSDEEMVAETYGQNQKNSSTSKTTKKQKITESSPTPSPLLNSDNNMDVDDKNENEHPLSSETDVPSPNFTRSAIDSYKEYIPNKRTNIRNLPPKIRFQYKTPIYKKVTLTFNKASAVEYLLSQHKWGILIENFLIRINPLDENIANFKERTTPTYIVTGIPLNATVLDLSPLTDHLKARSIEFLPTKSVSLHKVANIYCNTNDQDFVAYNKFNTCFEEFKLHIYPAESFNLNDTCGYCGQDGHNIYHCTEKNYTIIPHNQERRFRKKFIKRPNSYNLNDEMKNSYDQIKSLTNSHKNRPGSQKRQNPDSSYSQAHRNAKTKEYTNRAGYSNNFQRRPQASPHGNLYNWDEPPNLNAKQSTSSGKNKEATPHSNLYNWDEPPRVNAKQSTSSGKNKEVELNNSSKDDLMKRIIQLETIIKDLGSEIGGLNIKQKQQAKDISLLQEQERRHEKDMAQLNQHLTTINNNMVAQSQTIASIPRIVTMLENMEKSGIFSQIAHNNNDAYGNANYSYPPHSSFTEEEQQHYYNEEYEDSNSGYESSGTVETRDIFPDPNYTPSKPTGGYPTITSTIGSKFTNMIGYGQRRQ
ncbi:hypothetical protein RhiirA4_452489 [Rhizophagus irregularis]|uniref:Uncharacterized protein n=1 Tax=Rhizophagus irregularis TaxID=588596 RepID=A0A2I1FY93_9GLOM|nr:hypothetical protein RhiirA4_452489 [Rhizophagus irregularis]